MIVAGALHEWPAVVWRWSVIIVWSIVIVRWFVVVLGSSVKGRGSIPIVGVGSIVVGVLVLGCHKR